MTITPEMLSAIENDIRTAKAEKTRISMRDAIAQLAPLIRAKLSDGLTLQEIHAVFAKHLPKDDHISESTFRKYVREAGGKTGGAGEKRRQPGKARPARPAESGAENPIKDDGKTEASRGFRPDREDI